MYPDAGDLIVFQYKSRYSVIVSKQAMSDYVKYGAGWAWVKHFIQIYVYIYKSKRVLK